MTAGGKKGASGRRRSWEEVRAARLTSADARAGYEEARSAAEVGEIIRQARLQVGLTQGVLAERMNTTQSAIARLEAGGLGTTTIETLDKVAAALGLELALSFHAAEVDG